MFLKQSTEVIVRLGQFVDLTDAVTPETGITLGAADQAEVLKGTAGAATVDISGNTWAAITGAGGMYNLTLTASNTDTIGPLSVVVADASVCLPVVKEFFVVSEEMYDNLLSGAALLSVNTTEFAGESAAGLLTSADSIKADVQRIDGVAAAAENLSLGAQGMVTGTVQTASTTTKVTSNLSKAVNDFYVDRSLVFVSGALLGQATTITAYNGATKDLTVNTLTSAPSNGDLFVIV